MSAAASSTRETSCRDVRRYLGACLDGELEPSLTAEIERHLEGCRGCRQDATLHRELHRELRDAVRADRAPDALRSRLVEALANAPMPEPKRRSSGPRMLPLRYTVPIAVAAAAVLAIGARTTVDGATREAGLAPVLDDVVRGHARAFPAEVKSVEGEEVASWFRGKVEFPVRPIRFGSQRAKLVGARLSNVRERQAATLYYDVAGRRVTVFVFEPQDVSIDGTARTQIAGREVLYGSARGYNVAIVRRNGVAYALSSDLDQRAMLRLAAAASIQ